MSDLCKFQAQRGCAKKRGIGWELTFEEWLDIWLKSGKYDQRGKKPHEYCMARLSDAGPYMIGNVKIVTNDENRREFKPTRAQNIGRVSTRAYNKTRWSDDCKTDNLRFRGKLRMERVGRKIIFYV